MAHIHNNQISNPQQLMIGADPELLVIDPVNLAPVEASYRWNGSHGDISRDGGDYQTAEIRPAPGSPRQVTENIGHIIRTSLQNNASYNDKLLVAGGGATYQKAVGGHIHFNVHFGSVGQGDSSSAYSDDKSRILKSLDQFIGIPMKALPGGLRHGAHYGQLSEARTKNYGFEYRTPPSWLSDPALTESILSVAYLLMKKMLEQPDFALTTAAVENDYMGLIPNEAPFRRHWEHQVVGFMDFIFGGFNLETLDMRERWNAPALIEWKRGNTMLNMLGAFQTRIETAKAEAARLAAERATREAERQRLQAIETLERETRRRQEREGAAISQAQRMAMHTAETNVWASFGAPVTPSSIKTRARYFGAKVFIHRRSDSGSSYSSVDNITQQNVQLRVGALRIIESDGYTGWHNFRVTSGRVSTHRPSWRGARALNLRNNIIYMSKDLKPLIRRDRSQLFKIKFVDIQTNGTTTPRTVLFSVGQGWNAETIMGLLRTTKPRVPQNFYNFETNMELADAQASAIARSVPAAAMAS